VGNLDEMRLNVSPPGHRADRDECLIECEVALAFLLPSWMQPGQRGNQFLACSDDDAWEAERGLKLGTPDIIGTRSSCCWTACYKHKVP